MTFKRIAILPIHSTTSFGQMIMPDGSSMLVLNQRVHEKALEAADKKLQKAMKSAKRGATTVGRRAGKAA